MDLIVTNIISILHNTVVQVIAILAAAVVLLTEISKVCKWTPSTWDDTVVAKFITEITSIIELLKKLIFNK